MMDRKRYLVRKFDSFHYPEVRTSGDAICLCNCNNVPYKSYDLQTQTVTFGEESKPKKDKKGVFSCTSLLKKFSEDSKKASNSCPKMDQDLEFYPVDDHPSPSTFTAWDAFLTGNQAFFREPPCLLPDPAFSYMDVIPEEDDMEALLESDTDDTGSSVSTVIDRFSRASTANSSFSERCSKSSAEVTFDLEQVLSPFEKLEKELDAEEPKDSEELQCKKDTPRGPIVVITNSSSCEDVHSAGEDETSKEAEVKKDSNSVAEDLDSNNVSNLKNGVIADFQEKHTAVENVVPEPISNEIKNSGTVVSPPVPSRSKLSNTSKNSEKPVKAKGKIGSPPTSTPKKKSYPTPSVPPRMSKHLPARRTRSDPGSADQPSRIPRPIFTGNRPSVSPTITKSSPKSSRSPKINVAKKSKVVENSKSNNNKHSTSIEIQDAPAEAVSSEPEPEQNNVTCPIENIFDETSKEIVTSVNSGHEKQVPPVDNSSCNGLEASVHSYSDSSNISKVKVFNNAVPVFEGTLVDSAPIKDVSKEISGTNPFRMSETNPFKGGTDCKNPFLKVTNPFEDRVEEIPALQSKGQTASTLIPPPIPERPSLKAKPAVCQQETDAESTSSENISSKIEISIKNGNDSCEINAASKENAVSQRISSPVTNHVDAIKNDEELAINGVSFPPKSSEPSFWGPHSPEDCINKERSDLQQSSETQSTDGVSSQQRPIEDILQALDQLVLSAPREVEISIDWGTRGHVNIREKAVVPSTASGNGSTPCETDGLSDDRRRCIEDLLKEVDECLRMQKVGEDSCALQTTEETTLPASECPVPVDERNPLCPGTPDAPTAGSTQVSPPDRDVQESDTVALGDLLEHSSEMLKHQLLRDEQNVRYSSSYQEEFDKVTDQVDQDSLVNKHHSSGCDDSGVFLEEPFTSSPETQAKSALARLQNSLQKFADEPAKMRQYSIHEGLDSDAEKSDDLGLASSSIDSADDLDGDPLPSTLQIVTCPPVVPTRQKPPPIPARKSKFIDQQKNNKVTALEVPKQRKIPLSKSSSSEADSNFGEGEPSPNEDFIAPSTISENSKNILNLQKSEQSRNNFAMTRSFHEEMLVNQQKELNYTHDSKTNFLARTLSSSPSVKKLDVINGTNRRNSEHASSLKWKSEECLRTAAEAKWSIPGRRYEKSVSVKDRIAMFSEMEASQNSSKRDLQRYGSENNIKTVTLSVDNKKIEHAPAENNKFDNLRDSKWHSMHSIAKKCADKEIPYSNMKPALSIPSLASNSLTDNICYATLPVKLDVEPPKPIISTYPETQLTNNKRYNYGLYSLKNLKNTEDLLSKKAAGSNLLSIIDRKQPLQKLKGLVIPDKPMQPNSTKELPTIVSSDTDGLKDSRRASLPVTVVTSCKTMSLPRNKKLECPPPVQRQKSLSEPPWKNESNNNNCNILPKYSPAFKKRSLELPGSSLSPTPPSSITSPLSPPPSSPSSICSSNASSTLQQNIFQFSLSHSKPVQPLQPEKALMSPPSISSDVEYEGDNSEDSSHSASPMRNVPRESKDTLPYSQTNSSGVIHYGKSNTFTSNARNVSHQPLSVENLGKTSKLPDLEHPKTTPAIYVSKTEIRLKHDESRIEASTNSKDFGVKVETENNEKQNGCTSSPYAMAENNSPMNESYLSETSLNYLPEGLPNYAEKKNDVFTTSESLNKFNISNGTARNGVSKKSQNYSEIELESKECNVENIEIPVGKFRALPLSFKESQAKEATINGSSTVKKENSIWVAARSLNSECDESEDDDSHSTLSHRTEDSRHTTTDDCLSDATTDSFEKTQLASETCNLNKSNEDCASTEGYLSDASTDVSLRRFTNRQAESITYSTEEYLSDATTESPDPDWISNRGFTVEQLTDSNYRSYVKNEKSESSKSASCVQRESESSNTAERNVDLDLRPRRLSQQRTVLKAATEPSGSVQKFKALAEKWEQRSDVTSPPPPPTVGPTGIKKELRTNTIAAAILTTTTTSTVIKGRSSLPPSLMPRNATLEKKTSSSSTHSSKESHHSLLDGEWTGVRSVSSKSILPANDGWFQQTDEVCHVEPTGRRDSTSSSSSSSKTTLKEEDRFESPPLVPDSDISESVDSPPSSFSVLSASLQPRQSKDLWNNEPRNRRGADFTKSQPSTDWSRPSFGSKASFSVSDIRRSFENGGKDSSKPLPSKKVPPTAIRHSLPVAPRRTSTSDRLEEENEIQRLIEEAQSQLLEEEAAQLDLLGVILRREGEGGGSVGITLAGGADYEVKEITVHKVIAGSIADRDGNILKGDRVMSINGRDLRGVSHGEALHILKSPSPRVVLILARPKESVPTIQKEINENERRRKDCNANRDSEVLIVEIQKDATGVGFSIEGGKDSPQGDRPLLIKRIFKGGAADKEGKLEEGDEILAINNHPVNNMTRTEAWNFLKKLPEGPIFLKAKKVNILS